MSAEMTLKAAERPVRTKSRKSVPLCLGACFMITALMTGLVGLRLYSLSLEYRLARIQQEIVSREDTQNRLEKELARLVSPSRVFARATNDLGMQGAPRVAVVRVNTTGHEPVLAMERRGGGFKTDTNREGSMIEGIMNLLTRKASARQ